MSNNYVKFSAFGVYTEEWLNYLLKSGTEMWDIEKSGGLTYIKTKPKHYGFIARSARKFRVKTAVAEKRGIYFKLARYRKRYGILSGAIAFALILVIMSGFVWDIKITGNEKLTRAQITEILYKNGITPGVRVGSYDPNKTEQRLLLAFDELAWVSVERLGSRVIVKLSEREESGDVQEIPVSEPCNVIAAKSGQIVETEVYRGKLLYEKDSGINRGDVIVSGVVEDGAGSLLFVHADAKIIAEMTETIKFYQSYTSPQTVKTGMTAQNRYIVFLGKRFPLFLRRANAENARYSEETLAPAIFGYPLPYRVFTETYEYRKTVRVTDTREDALVKLEEQIDIYEKNFFAEAEIVSKEVDFVPDADGIGANVKYVYREDIAEKRGFSVT